MNSQTSSDTPPPPLRPGLRSLFMLKEGVCFLNHGSFGATPRAVFDAHTAWRRLIEAEPVELIGRRNFDLIAEAKRPIARRFGMNDADVGFVTNATEGINAVVRSLALQPGDELLTTDHVYHAIRQTMRLVARRAGAEVREVKIELPVTSGDQIAGALIGAITSRTRLVLVDHITSPTALVFPVGQIAAECAQRGVPLLIDGAHAPGQVPLDVAKLGAHFYAANLHKWVCAPKGTAFLWVKPDQQHNVHPAVISHFLDEGFTREFGWQGTRDIGAWLTAPAALDFMDGLGWEKVLEHNHRLAAWAHRMLCARWNVKPVSPLDGSLLGSMASVPLPGKFENINLEQTETLQQRLYSQYNIEVPLMRWNERSLLRVSCQVYNEPAEYERLADLIVRM